MSVLTNVIIFVCMKGRTETSITTCLDVHGPILDNLGLFLPEREGDENFQRGAPLF